MGFNYNAIQRHSSILLNTSYIALLEGLLDSQDNRSSIQRSDLSLLDRRFAH